MLDKYKSLLSIETETPATSITPIPSKTGSSMYHVKTNRGTIECRHVVHCTNSHASHFLPGLRSKIIPIRDQMTEQDYSVPSGQSSATGSWIFFWDKGVDYMIHRPKVGDRPARLLLGGGLSHAGDDGLDEVGRPGDNDQSIVIPAYLSGLLPNIFATRSEARTPSTWTGILGWSADLLPWVGPVPTALSERPYRHGCSQEVAVEPWEKFGGQEWISAGYSGEGMTLAWRCGKAIAYKLLGIDKEECVDEWLPEGYIITEARAKEAYVRKLKELY